MQAPTNAAREPDAAKALRVLLVDDDDVDRIAVRRALRGGGLRAEFREEHRCADGLAALRQGTFDCVFLDYLLPDGTGLEFVRQARADGHRVPILVLTGQGDESVAVELMKAGATDYLAKGSATPERIAQSVLNALRLHRAERQADLAEKERARLFDLEQTAREEAEAAQKRLAFLAEASALVSASLDYETTLQNVVSLAVPSLADWAFIDLLQPDGSFTRTAIAHVDPTQRDLARRLRRSYAPMPDAPHGETRVLATGQSEVLPHVPEWLLLTLARDSEHYASLVELRFRSYMCVPLVARGRALGAMTFLACHSGRTYTAQDLAFAEEIARRAALGVDNARLYREARAAEDRLRHQLEFTTAITDSLAEGVCALDVQGRFTFANRAAEGMFGQSMGWLVGRPLSEILRSVDGVDVAHDTNPVAHCLREGTLVRSDDATFVRADGGTLLVSFTCSPILLDGAVSGAVLAFHDIRSRKRAEAELDASRRQLAQNEKLSALGTLVSGVAHELRTPLTYLSNNLFLLQTRLDAHARETPAFAPIVHEVTRFGQAALEGVDRINALVKDLKPFAQQENGRRLHASLHDVVAGAVELFRATSRGQVELAVDLAPTPTIQLDKGQIQRVVINLLVNAQEAMPRGGRITVRTRPVPGGAEVEVADEGDGIPPEVEARMFDPFFTTKPDGTGLGLAITRRILESHRGGIRHRTTLGEGTTFTVFLPAPQAAPPPADVPLQPLVVGDGDSYRPSPAPAAEGNLP